MSYSISNFWGSAFILDYHAPAVLRTVTECLDFLRAPCRIEIAGRQDRHEQSGVRELLDDFQGKNIISCQFLVPPNLGLLAEPHAGAPLALRLTHAHR